MLKIVFLFLVVCVLLLLITKNCNEHFTDIEPEIYVVNLESDKDRWINLKKNADKQNLNIKRFNAIDGRKIDLNLKKYSQYFNSNKLKPGQKGCALSHIFLWNQLKNGNPEDIIIIIEDDGIIPKNLNDKIKMYMKQAPSNWEMIILGGNRFKGRYYSKNLIKPVINKYGNWGTFGYMIKRKCAKKLLNNCRIMKTTIDHHLNLNFYSQNNVYFCVPQIIYHDYDYYSNILNKVRTDDSERNNKVEII